jgi:hypothetical protein
MNKSSLHEVAKFAAGLVAADFLWLLWFSQQKIASITFIGATFTHDVVIPGLIFDLALFIILVHYAWHIGKIPAMRERSYVFLAGCVFTFVAAAHLWRIFSGADLVLGNWDAPVWLSWLGVAITTYLAYMSFHLVARIKGK